MKSKPPVAVKTRAKAERETISDDPQELDEVMSGRAVEDYEDAEKLGEFMEQFGGKEYKVRLEQMNATDKVWEFLDTFPLDGFDAFETCKKFGRGRYRLTFLNERGKYVKGGQPQIRIGGVIPTSATSPAPVAESDPLKHPMIVMMMAQMKDAATQQTELLKVILAKPEPAKSSSVEVLDMLAKLKAMTPEKKEDGTMAELSKMLLVKMIEKGLDNSEGGSSGGEGGILGEIKDAMPIIKEILAGKLQTRSVAPPQNVTPPVRVSLPSPSKEAPMVAEIHPAVADLLPFAAVLARKAENKVEVERSAQWLIDEIYDSVVPIIKTHIPVAKLASEEAIVESLVGRAKDPAQLEEIFKAAPVLAPHREWVLAVIAKAVEILTTEEVPGETDGQEA